MAIDYSGQYFGRYHITQQLGAGGMATVYKAFDTRLERSVAIKVIRSDAVGDTMFLQRFERESRALARLSHPNIVKILDYGDHEGIPYLVMEYVPAGTLKQYAGRPLPFQEAVRLLEPIARALEHAHQQTIIHRDIKPANILLTDTGEPMLTDFGIAKILSGDSEVELTRTGVGIGTPEYMAPEQGMGQKVDHRADIFALGIVFFELITGYKPYEADTPLAVLMKIMQEPLPRPRDFNSSIPEAVERVIFKALARLPQDRYSTAADLAAAMQNLVVDARTRDQTATQALSDADLQQTLGKDNIQTVAYPSDPYYSQPAVQPSAPAWQPVPLHPRPLPQQPAAPMPPPIEEPRRRGLPTWVWVVGGGVLLVAVIAAAGIAGAFIMSGGTITVGQPTDIPPAASTLADEITAKTPATEEAASEALTEETSEAEAPPELLPADKSLHLGTTDQEFTLDPSAASSTMSYQIIDLMALGLTRLNETSAGIEPGMAEYWQVADDARTYTFHLRQDVPWVRYDAAADEVVIVTDCDGNERMVNANDFVFGIQRALDPQVDDNYGYEYVFGRIQGAEDFIYADTNDPNTIAVEALDDYTLQISFNEPAIYNPLIAGMVPARAQPSWVIEGSSCESGNGERWIESGFYQSYGPYTLKKWTHESSISLVKNPFWPATDVIPSANIGTLTWHIYADMETAFAEYEAGGLDVAPVPIDLLDHAREDSALSQELFKSPSNCTYLYNFNTKAEFVSDVRVRRALSMAVDREGLIRNIQKGGHTPAQWFTPPYVSGMPQSEKYSGWGIHYDPDAAMAELESYLEQTGQSASDLELTLMYNTSSGHQSIAEAIVDMWAETLGIAVSLEHQEWSAFLKTVKTADSPQIYRYGWCEDYPDASSFIREVYRYGGTSNNDGGTNWGFNSEFENLLSAAEVENNLETREKLYADAEQILVYNEAVMIPLYWYGYYHVAKPYVERTNSILNGVERIEKWDIDMDAKE